MEDTDARRRESGAVPREAAAAASASVADTSAPDVPLATHVSGERSAPSAGGAAPPGATTAAPLPSYDVAA